MKSSKRLTHTELAGNRSLSEKAYQLIRERILRGQLRIGEALSRRRLAEELGMSLLPISEALQRLEHDVAGKPPTRGHAGAHADRK